jgi:hypothetical protein
MEDHYNFSFSFGESKVLIVTIGVSSEYGFNFTLLKSSKINKF